MHPLTLRNQRRLAVVSLAAAVCFAVLEALFASQVDIDVYLMGGAHASNAHLYALEYAHTRLYFTYPPFAAIFFWPFAHLPNVAARLIWALLNVVGMLWLSFVTIRALRPELPRATHAPGDDWATSEFEKANVHRHLCLSTIRSVLDVRPVSVNCDSGRSLA